MLHVTATATGSTGNYGVYNTSSSPSMNNVTATATGGTTGSGVYNFWFVVAVDEQCDRHRHRRHRQLRRVQHFVVAVDEQCDRHR